MNLLQHQPRQLTRLVSSNESAFQFWLRRKDRDDKISRMGSWGFLPLQNDAALDWYQQLFDEAGLAAYVESSLNLDLHEDPEDIRAAAFFVHTLVKVGLWPQHQRAKLINLAVLRLQQLLTERVFTNANFVSEIRCEIKALTELLPSLGKPENHPLLDGPNP